MFIFAKSNIGQDFRMSFMALDNNSKFCRTAELFVLLLLAAILRLWHIGKADIGSDECFSLFYSQFAVPDMISVLFQGDNPPLWEILLHFWITLFGVNVLSIRLLSFVFNLLAVIPIYFIGEKFVKRHTGFFSALFYTFSSFSIFIAHEGRVYSLLGFLSACSLYLFLSLIDKKKTSNFRLLTITNVLIMYSHYLAIWLIVMEFLFFVSVRKFRESLGRAYLWHIAALFVAYLPVLPFLYARFLDSGLHGTWIDKCHSISDLYNMICCFTNAPVPAVCAIVLLFACLAKIIYQIVKRNYSVDSLTVIFFVWLVPMMVSFAVSFKIGFFYNRYFYFLLPAYMLTLSNSIFYLFENKRVIKAALYIAFAVAMIFSLKTDTTQMRYGGWKGEYAKAVNAMVELKEDKNAVVIIAPDWLEKQIVYYLDENHSLFKNEGNPRQEHVFASYLQKNGYYYEDDYYEINVIDNQYVICINNDFYDISKIKNWLDENGYEESQVRKYTQMEVTLFRRR